MIAFGCSITSPEIYARCAEPGIRLAAEAGSEIFVVAASGPLARTYNLILAKAAARDDLEALVLVHQDAELLDPDLCGKLRRALADPDVAVVGCVGATGADSIAWWDGAVTWGSTVYRYGELGGGEISLDGGEPPSRTATREVDSVYGFLLALSPWAVRTLRFDETLGRLHGYDFDLCRQARAAGRRVLVADIPIAHHHALQLVPEPDVWIESHIVAAEKWDRGPADGDWKQRARRAEAEAAASRLLGASKLLQAYARAQHHEYELAAITETASWRITAPLRRLNALLATRRRRRT